MYDYEQVEYAIFHWVFGGEYCLPGINPNGFLNPAFFEKYPTKSSYKSFSDLFSKIKSNPDLNDTNALMLCSGGVDSSLLAYFRKNNLEPSPQSFIHTSYVEHNNNDLYKFINVLNLCPGNSFVNSINDSGYLKGLDILSEHNFYQNTYAPTLAFSLNSIGEHNFSNLITGSGPDELFYGMEKYSWREFEKLQDVPIVKALEILDPSYNKKTYVRLFNNYGKELYELVSQKRKKLYESISELEMNIFDSQRILAYATVTAQHMELFNKIAKIFKMKHKAPYLNENLVQLAFSTPLTELISLGSDKRVEIGKKYLKKYLSKYMSYEHVYGKKIGFHAPTSRYVWDYSKSFLIENIELIPNWLNKDKTLNELNIRFSKPLEFGDYFLYSLINLIKHNIRNTK